MITPEQISAAVKEIINPAEHFIVDVNVQPGNHITILVDGFKGFSLDDCVNVNRGIEARFNRDIEDYELEVSSPGLTQPFKVKEQYLKNFGKEVEVLLKNGNKVKGILKNFANNGIDIESSSKVKGEGSKKKETVTQQQFIEFEKIKSTKLLISFK